MQRTCVGEAKPLSTYRTLLQIPAAGRTPWGSSSARSPWTPQVSRRRKESQLRIQSAVTEGQAAPRWQSNKHLASNKHQKRALSMQGCGLPWAGSVACVSDQELQCWGCERPWHHPGSDGVIKAQWSPFCIYSVMPPHFYKGA